MATLCTLDASCVACLGQPKHGVAHALQTDLTRAALNGGTGLREDGTRVQPQESTRAQPPLEKDDELVTIAPNCESSCAQGLLEDQNPNSQNNVFAPVLVRCVK